MSGSHDDEQNIDAFELDMTNDPEIERLGANRTVQHALTFWKTLCRAARRDGLNLDPIWNSSSTADGEEEDDDVSASSCHCTKQIVFEQAHTDDRLYARFRSNLGPYWNIASILSSSTLNPLSGEKWSALLIASEGVVDDYNFMTLLRTHALDMFWSNQESSSPDLLVVPRAQFVCVELARCREGLYAGAFRQRLQAFDLTAIATALEEAAVTRRDGPGAMQVLERLRSEWPYPNARLLRSTGIVNALQKVYQSTESSMDEMVRSKCLEQLRQWQDVVTLGRVRDTLLEHDSGVSMKRQIQALERSARSLCSGVVSRTTKDESKSTYKTKNTATLADVVAGNDAKITSIFEDFGIVVLPGYCSLDEISVYKDHAAKALEALQSEHLTPRGLRVAGDNIFDFVECRQRPGHRVDNRYKILDDPNIKSLGTKLMAELPAKLTGSTTGEGSFKLLYAGVVHSFPSSSKNDPPPPPQLWHRDGPSLFTNAHHSTHCFNVFVPLVDVDIENGTTEFVPGTHEDARYDAVAADVVLGRPMDDAKTIAATVEAGAIVAFDVRVMHRGLSNASLQERPVLYFTFARDWFQEEHMFQKTETLRPNCYTTLCQELYHTVTANTPSTTSTAIGHPHYTTRFDLLLLEQFVDPHSTEQGVANASSVVQFSNMSDKDAVAQEFVRILSSQHAMDAKATTLVNARARRREQQPGDNEEGQDFASIQTDMSDISALYDLTARLLFQEADLCSTFHFTKNEAGVCTFLALLKAYTTSHINGTEVTAPAIEECFSSWWNACPGPNCRFELVSTSPTNTKVLVVFSSLGSGICRPEWKGTLRSLWGSAMSLDGLDVLHVMDPAFSWYCQDPTASWKGGAFYKRELAARTAKYDATCFLGDSMGAAAALRFCGLGNVDRVVAFTPQVDICHYDALTRTDFLLSTRHAFRDALVEAVRSSHASIVVHYGAQCEEDVRQVKLLPSNVKLVPHNFDDHVLSLHLRNIGELLYVVGQELEKFLGQVEC